MWFQSDITYFEVKIHSTFLSSNLLRERSCFSAKNYYPSCISNKLCFLLVGKINHINALKLYSNTESDKNVTGIRWRHKKDVDKIYNNFAILRPYNRLHVFLVSGWWVLANNWFLMIFAWDENVFWRFFRPQIKLEI